MDEITLSQKKKVKDARNLLVFGYGLFLILAFFSWHTAHKHGVSWIVGLLGGLSVFMFVVTLVNKILLKMIYKKWMRGAHFIGSCISGLVLSLMFYLVFAPLGILFRLMRKDFLSRSFEKEKNSYWIMMEDKEFDPVQCERQF